MKRTVLRRLLTVATAVVCLLALAPAHTAAAELGFFGWGVRGGLSIDPEQVFGGIHVDLGQFSENVLFRPNVELGFGDDATVLSLNAAVHWLAPSRQSRWRPYFGGELGINHFELDRRPPFRDTDDTELALNAVAGVEERRTSGSKLGFEAKVGIIEDPRVKLLVAWTF